MYVIYELKDWPSSVRDSLEDVVAVLEGELEHLPMAVVLHPETSQDYDVAAYIIEAGKVDWLARLDVLVTADRIPGRDTLRAALVGAHALGAAWRRTGTEGLTDVLRAAVDEAVHVVTTNAWALDRRIYYADGRVLPEAREDDGDGELPAAVSSFRQHFRSPVYEDVTSELAPFGSDEGFDLVVAWGGRADELTQDMTVDDLLHRDGFDAYDRVADDVDAATIVTAAAFTLLRLTGRIDESGRELALRALDTLIGWYGPEEELAVQRTDLAEWQNPVP